MISSSYNLEIEEEALVILALLGNLKAFDELVHRYRRAILHVTRQYLNSREMAEDVTQEVFLLAFKALPQLADPSCFSSWLYRIARHRAQRVAGQSRNTSTVELTDIDRLILGDGLDTVKDPALSYFEQYEKACIAEMIASLPSDACLVLKLRYYEEWSIGEIAEFLLLPVSTVKWRLHKGRSLLRARIIKQKEEEENGKKQLEHGYRADTTPAA